MTDRELMQQALNYLDAPSSKVWAAGTQYKIIQALRARLAQPEQEPVAWVSKRTLDRIKDFDGSIYANGGFDDAVPLYTAPPQRGWQTLTENEIKHLWYEACQTNLELTSQLIVHLARNIEAKLKEKNQ